MGRHNAPRKPVLPAILKTGAVTLAATSPLVLFAPSAMAAPVSSSILEVIAKCESGNQNVNHNSKLSGVKSTASGYLQILDSTWRAFGGTQFASRAINASREEQFIVGARVLAGQGISAWNPSRSCWGSKIGSVPKKIEIPDPPKKVTPAKKAVTYANCDAVRAAGKAPIKPGDEGWSKKFDGDNDGIGCETPKAVSKPAPKPEVKKSVVSAPKTIKKVTPPPTKVVAKKIAKSYLIRKGDTLSQIAKTHGSTVRRLASLNSDTVSNVNLIYAGKKLRLG